MRDCVSERKGERKRERKNEREKKKEENVYVCACV